jgi:hypothetical protein
MATKSSKGKDTSRPSGFSASAQTPWQSFLAVLASLGPRRKRLFVSVALLLLVLYMLWVSFPESVKRDILYSVGIPSPSQQEIISTPSPTEAGERASDAPSTLFCFCEAEQTRCFDEESECRNRALSELCVTNYGTNNGFNVANEAIWTKYGPGWIREGCAL